MRFLSLLVLMTTSLSLSNCSLKTMAVQQMGEIVADGVPAFEKDDDLELIRDAIPGNLKLLEAMLESDPGNRKIPTILAQMYASYSFAFLEGDLETPGVGDKAMLKERINRFYERGQRYGERALIGSNKKCEQGLKVLTELDSCLSGLDKDDVPALYWYGFNIAAYMNRNLDSMAALAQGPKMEKVMQRVVALNESYNFGSAHLFLMLYYGGRSQMMGGNAKKGDDHYKAIQKLAGTDFVLADVFYARYVLVQNDDREGFEKMLKAAIARNVDTDKAPQLRLYNSLAKSRAKLYLNSVEDLF
ncbi:MAG TPA: TRAP transporter TatT component family protein [Oligoflexus sp.]|uniref:TRAP transporter TatT component family protein n=1 Tax=Oligoflexus sp. TaxID=1971216 RepID=UPI002D3DCB87|nr:TRAP transporter TatT component family protein [Oligoflexus sp.]HYX36674.1 TRAP transporter TatT component family protein [Oligoflexus sp.]